MQSQLLLVLGIAITAFGIYVTVVHPRRWRNHGIAMAVGGVGINVLNFTLS